MNNLQSIWSNRFQYYMNELQKYLKYVFTGHLVLVLVFTLGAGGYAYSEWLKTVPADFPSALIAAILIGATLTYSSPVTLLKEADIVYFLPLEYKLFDYMKKALQWSTFAQMPLPIVVYIVTLPLLSATVAGSKFIYLWILVFIVVLKWFYVRTEYDYMIAKRGQAIWMNRFVQFVFAFLLFYLLLTPAFVQSSFVFGLLIILVAIFVYGFYWKKQAEGLSFPFEYFIRLEQNRMMRFYRFANYFTDVPHIKGSVSKRNWLNFFMKPARVNGGNPQQYLIRRTFIRTDDLFWLWVRLTIIAAVGAAFLTIPIVIYIFVGALAFASTIQLLFALQKADDFRMDMLFPIAPDARTEAIERQVKSVQYIQALFVGVGSFIAYGLSVVPFLACGIVVISSIVTVVVTKKK